VEGGADPGGVGNDQFAAGVGSAVAAFFGFNCWNLSSFNFGYQCFGLINLQKVARAVAGIAATGFVKIIEGEKSIECANDGGANSLFSRETRNGKTIHQRAVLIGFAAIAKALASSAAKSADMTSVATGLMTSFGVTQPKLS
jgi:hypothetical protein